MKELIPQEVVERRIFVIRGQKVMLDRDLAGLAINKVTLLTITVL
jgi:hypothetical protein